MAYSLEDLAAREGMILAGTHPLSFLPNFVPRREPIHILSADQFTRQFVDEFLRHVLLHVKPQFEKGRRQHRLGSTHSDRMGILLFEEPSTRTRSSFVAAALHTGHRLDSIQGVQFSSRAKGESLTDMISTLCCYSPDVIIYRSKQAGGAKEAASASIVPIINAGDGNNEHPTQAMLDMMTILLETGSLSNRKVAMVGDLWNGRTVRSLTKLLSLYDGNELYFVSPEPFRMRDDIKAILNRRQIRWHETDDLEAVLPDVHAVYTTRLQSERFETREDGEDPQKAAQRDYLTSHPDAFAKYRINTAQLWLMNPNARVLHPLPRNDELPHTVDDDPKVAIYRQMYYGGLARIGFLDLVHGELDGLSSYLLPA